MKLAYAFERLELHARGRVIDLLPHPALRRAFGYVVPVVRPWPLRVRWTGVLMTLDLLLFTRLARRPAQTAAPRATDRALGVRHAS